MKPPVSTVCAVLTLVAGAARAAAPPTPSRLVAFAGGRAITENHLAARLRLRGVDPATATREQWQSALQGAINRAVLLDAARRAGVQVTDRAAEDAIRSRRTGPMAEAYERRRRALRLEGDREKTWMRDRLVLTRFVNARLGSKLHVPPRAVAQWYERHQALLAHPEVRVARVITLAAKPDPDAARRRLEQIRARLTAGADFGQLAKQHSADPWAPRGGRLDPITKGDSGSVFCGRLFTLTRPGDVTEVFQTQRGLHLLRLDEVRPSVVPPFETVQEAIRERLLDELRARHIPELARTLRAETSVRIVWSHLPPPAGAEK